MTLKKQMWPLGTTSTEGFITHLKIQKKWTCQQGLMAFPGRKKDTLGGFVWGAEPWVHLQGQSPGAGEGLLPCWEPPGGRRAAEREAGAA